MDVRVSLGAHEAAVLEAHARRHLRWDPLSVARVVTTGTALGVFTSPPLGVLAFAAVPVQGSVERCDVTVTMSAFADALPLMADGGMDLATIPEVIVPPAGAPSVHHLPPSEGWHMPIPAVSGDLVPLVTEAIEEFRQRAVSLGDFGRQTLAEEIWSRPGWAGLPLRMLHAAYRLGFLPDDQSRVSASACGPWRRLQTVRGQVFGYDRGASARLALHVVR